VRVVPAVQHLGELADGRELVILSVEWEASDDAGISYQPTGSGGGGGPNWLHMTQEFVPAPPSETVSMTFVAFEYGRDGNSLG
jgi:hypothetical protein